MYPGLESKLHNPPSPRVYSMIGMVGIIDASSTRFLFFLPQVIKHDGVLFKFIDHSSPRLTHFFAYKDFLSITEMGSTSLQKDENKLK